MGLFSAEAVMLRDETPHDTERKVESSRPVTAALAVTGAVVARAVDVLA